MNKKTLIFPLIIILAIIAGLFVIFSQKPSTSANGLTLYTRYDCPHCQNVEKFITDNKIKDKVNIQDKEIHDQKNSNGLVKAAGTCGIPQDQIGVPLLTDGKKCYVGDKDIIDYLTTNYLSNK